MSLHSMKKLVRRSWDAIPMPDTVIAQVNQIGKDEPEQFVFTNLNGRNIGDIEFPGVDGGQNQTPQLDNELDVENIDLEIAPNNEIQEEAVPPEPTPIKPHIKVETIKDGREKNDEPAQTPTVSVPTVPKSNTGPDEIPGVRKSTRVRFPTKPEYIPSISGSSRDAYAVTQLESLGALHPDAHMFFNHTMCAEDNPDVVVSIMTQLSLKAGLKQWGVEPKRQSNQK